MSAKKRKAIARYCYLLPTYTLAAPARQRIKNRLGLLAGVVRITDHGTHLKVHSNRRDYPALKGALLVRDQTRDVDPMLWTLVLPIFRHALRYHPKTGKRALGIAIHYLCNLFGEVESEGAFLTLLGAARAHVDQTVTDEEAHGWELRALGNARQTVGQKLVYGGLKAIRGSAAMADLVKQRRAEKAPLLLRRVKRRRTR